MKICTPLRRTRDVNRLIKNGATEFYAGTRFTEWELRYGPKVELNKRGFCGKDANFNSFEEVTHAVSISHASDCEIYITLNQNQYVRNQMPILYDLIDNLASIKVDGVIVAQLSLILYAVKKGLKVIVSTDAVSCNSQSVSFFKSFGANRVILPRSLSLDEIESIRINHPDIEIEVFMLNGPCQFTDGICLALHSTKWNSMCSFIDNREYEFFTHDETPVSWSDKYKLLINNFYYQKFYRTRACGLCAIWRLKQIGVDAIKLVGRVLPVARVEQEVSILKKLLNYANICKTEKEYLSMVSSPFDDPQMCKNGYQCYYPEVYNSNEFR